jgi:hypothetical protein
MFYNFAITVPAGTTASKPVMQTLKLTKGVIHRVEIGFPAGCRGYVYLVLNTNGHQLYPTDPEGAFNAEGYTIPINDYFPLDADPYSLKAIAWSPDAIYDHIITVRIGILPEEILSPLTGLGTMLNQFLKFMGIGG